MTGGSANTLAHGARGGPPLGRHVVPVGRAGAAAPGSAGARHGAAGHPARHLPRRHPHLPRVRPGAHDVGRCGGHGERRLAAGGGVGCLSAAGP